MDSQLKSTSRESEDKRAFRIAIRLDGHHARLTTVYESLVDRDFSIVEKEIKSIRADLLLILKSMEDDDF